MAEIAPARAELARADPPTPVPAAGGARPILPLPVLVWASPCGGRPCPSLVELTGTAHSGARAGPCQWSPAPPLPVFSMEAPSRQRPLLLMAYVLAAAGRSGSSTTLSGGSFPVREEEGGDPSLSYFLIYLLFFRIS